MMIAKHGHVKTYDLMAGLTLLILMNYPIKYKIVHFVFKGTADQDFSKNCVFLSLKTVSS